ncbi:MAG: hypothetical protein R3E98_01065 [Gemmatimonadota bacterium]
MRGVRQLRSLLLVALLSGCAGGVTADPAAHMGEHFMASVDLQTAVIRGDLEEARSHAEWLATHDEPTRMAATEEAFRGLRDAARAGASARTLTGMAEATARIAYQCGACHTATGSGPEMLPGSPPDPGADAQASMFGHIWGTDRMWEGLVAPSEPSWSAGARVLALSRLDASAVVTDPARQARLRDLEAEVTDVAEQAGRTGDGGERARLYGRLLATCAPCHQTLGLDPLGMPRSP